MLMTLNDFDGKFFPFCLNAQRVCRIQKFQEFTNYIGKFFVKPPVLGVVETWFTSDETGEDSKARKPIRLYEIEGYESCFSSRETRSAGIALYFKKGLSFELIDKGNGPVSFIHARLKLVGSECDEDVYFTLIYMPRLDHYSELFNFLERILNEIPRGKRHIIMGDFNIDVLKDDSISLAYYYLLLSYFDC